ncbi:MAG: ABC transporter permease [Rhizobiales bacterium 62-47]|nr:ABC transporter permease [Hyphomicrobiales bacterium]OJY11286.1 MAG: ABC transporter permease [Rhizobiales bacterium 62-47]
MSDALTKPLLSAVSILVLLVVWATLSTSGILPQGYLPTPSEISQDFTLLATQGYKGVSLYDHIGISLFRALSGFVLGVLLGVPLGLLTGFTKTGNALVSPIMAFLRPIPPIAFIPMVVLYFGLGETGKVVLIFWTAFNYVHVNAHSGAANVPLAYLRAAKSLGLTRWQQFFRIIFPAAIPQIFTGLRVAMALSWAVVVAAELTGAQEGLGYMISDAALTFRIPTVFIGIAIIGAIGLLLNLAIEYLETRIVHWRGR